MLVTFCICGGSASTTTTTSTTSTAGGGISTTTTPWSGTGSTTGSGTGTGTGSTGTEAGTGSTGTGSTITTGSGTVSTGTASPYTSWYSRSDSIVTPPTAVRSLSSASPELQQATQQPWRTNDAWILFAPPVMGPHPPDMVPSTPVEIRSTIEIIIDLAGGSSGTCVKLLHPQCTLQHHSTGSWLVASKPSAWFSSGVSAQRQACSWGQLSTVQGASADDAPVFESAQTGTGGGIDGSITITGGSFSGRSIQNTCIGSSSNVRIYTDENGNIVREQVTTGPTCSSTTNTGTDQATTRITRAGVRATLEVQTTFSARLSPLTPSDMVAVPTRVQCTVGHVNPDGLSTTTTVVLPVMVALPPNPAIPAAAKLKSTQPTSSIVLNTTTGSKTMQMVVNAAATEPAVILDWGVHRSQHLESMALIPLDAASAGPAVSINVASTRQTASLPLLERVWPTNLCPSAPTNLSLTAPAPQRNPRLAA